MGVCGSIVSNSAKVTEILRELVNHGLVDAQTGLLDLYNSPT